MANGQPGSGSVERAPVDAASDQDLIKRFLASREEAAFEALVRRHGPMVLAVCQRVLHEPHDVEDAFQATFLVLVRKAAAIGKPELLGNWLYGVAYRTARKARANAARRLAHERQVASMTPPDPHLELAWSDLRALLDSELHRLPDKYRAPLVLCYLQGKTNAEAAQLLGWPVGTMSSRLARARELLRERLQSRSAVLPVGLFTSLLAGKAGPALVPAGLIEATVHSGMSLLTAKTALASSLAPTVRALTDGVLEGMRAAQMRRTVALILVIVSLLIGSGAIAYAAVSGDLNNVSFDSYGSSASAGGGCR
jgi:RNA polymerase sigma factor (sigma-70 family)